MPEPFDVVAVPDFLSKKAPIFKMRTLFFLASWMENAGKARHFPLHLVCIGEPPASVKWLAAQCNAAVTVHDPLVAHRSINKLRGLEIEHQTDRLLLLDIDFLVISDISELSDLGRCIAARPGAEARVPEQHWQKIYKNLEIEPPTERMPTIRDELEIPIMKVSYPGEDSQSKAMYPYYNSGALFLPVDCGLKNIWQEHIQRISKMFTKKDMAWISVGHSDQAGLATAVEVLKRKGVPFKRLPDSYHAHIFHFYKSAFSADDVRLYHATGFCKEVAKLDWPSAQTAVKAFRRKKLTQRLIKEWYNEYGFKGINRLNGSLTSPIKQANRMLDRFYDRCKPHVQEALKREGQ